MKKIKYKVLGYTKVYNPETEEIEQKVCFADFIRDYSETNEAIAQREAYNGEYTIEDDGVEEVTVQTQEERIAELEEALELLLSGVTE